MQPTDIPDKDIPTADPGQLIIQYTPLLYRIAKRYQPVLDQTGSVDIDDLLQAGRIAIYTAQRTYDPEGGASFLSYVFIKIRGSMLYTLGYKNGKMPVQLEYLDEPLYDNETNSKLDYIPDCLPTAEESIIEQDTKDETTKVVHAAINRLKNEKQREVIERVYLRSQDRQTAANEMGIKIGSLYAADKEARNRLKRDAQLQWLCRPMISSSLKRFRETWESSVEALVLWKEKNTDIIYGSGYYVTGRKENSHDLDC